MGASIIGLDQIYYAKLVKDDHTGVEYEGTPKLYAGAIQLTASPTTNSATLYVDNQAAEVATSMGDISLTLNMQDLPAEVAADLLGSETDENGVLLSTSGDRAPYVAIAFRALKSDETYRYYWFYKGKFQPEQTDAQTRGETPTFQNPTLTATFMPRMFDKQWRARIDETDSNADPAVIANWFNQVYEKNA